MAQAIARLGRANRRQKLFEPFLTTEQVCDLLGVCRTTLYKFIRQTSFPAGLILGDGRRGFNPAEVNEWMHNAERSGRRK